MTALHYAVRYARQEMTELLLAAGAVTFAKTESVPAEYPLDWLRRYTAADAVDRNPNIPASEVAVLAQRLQPPSEAESAALGERLVVRAEREYAGGDAESSYRTLKNALRARPGYTRALSDLALVALRVGMIGESLAASQKVIDAKVDTATMANAWFNHGLACEQADGYFNYDGQAYCAFTPLLPFVTAWNAEPTAARARKIEELFGNDKKACVPQSVDGKDTRFFFAMEKLPGKEYGTRVYVYHASETMIDPASIVGQNMINTGRVASARTIATHDLGSFRLTILATTHAQPRADDYEGTRCRLNTR